MTAVAVPVRRTLPAGATFVLLASIVLFFLAGSSAPTPLYGRYAAQWGFTASTTTVVFGVYAIAVLASLLVAGRLSDHVGRRPVLLAGVAGQLVAMAVFTTASGVTELLVARVVQGLATGAAAAAVGAALVDVSTRHGALTNAVAAPLGTALGSIGGALLVAHLPAPTHLVYDVLAAVFLLQGLGVLLMAETVATRPGARASLRPTVNAPAATRRALAVAVPALLAGWSIAGLYGALGPAIVRQLGHSTSVVAGGASLAVVAGTAALGVYVLRGVEPGRTLAVVIPLMAVGVAITLAGVVAESQPLFFAGSVVAGIAFGGVFSASIRTTVPLAAPHERAGVLAVVYVASYVGLGIPAIVAGYLVVHGSGLRQTVIEYGAAVVALTAVAFVALLRSRRGAARAQAQIGATAAATTAPSGVDAELSAAPHDEDRVVTAGR
ncbi:MFS transporter [Cellulomonas alba]|uniref:MFS transporter n=1 Tax=Cellulomonas alba TaxID=3053467 RepID=A0ABT7SIT3_9CELL|nr:MFS transporter [Cellulomonas alba]MDM7855949.1 MFS transporter [Cellulomonas alba]